MSSDVSSSLSSTTGGRLQRVVEQLSQLQSLANIDPKKNDVVSTAMGPKGHVAAGATKSKSFFRLPKQVVMPLLLLKIQPEEMTWSIKARTHMFCLNLFLACSGWFLPQSSISTTVKMLFMV